MLDTVRVRMGWFHAWLGFLGGLLLFCIFLTGTVTVFDDEITRWMNPDAVVNPALIPTPVAIDRASDELQRAWHTDPFAFLLMPTPRRPGLNIMHYDGHAFMGPTLDPVDGHLVRLRATEGGQFFYDFHFTLRGGAMPGTLVVVCLGILMLIGIVSGLVLHFRALLPDLLTFRPWGTYFRAWLDGHLLTGVLCLPFIMMIAYTGVVIEMDLLLPTPARTGTTPVSNALALTSPVVQPFGTVMERAISEGGRKLAPAPIGFVIVGPHRISVYRSDGADVAMSREHADFNRADGAFLALTHDASAVQHLRQTMSGLHIAKWAPLPMRWLYFLSGAAGTALIGSGLVLFLIKRRDRFGTRVPFRLAEGATLAVVVGLPGASIGFLWANRLIPAGWAGRAQDEVAALFTLWLLWAVFAIAGSLSGRASLLWRRSLDLLMLLACLLPVLDWASRPVAGVVGTGVTCGVDGVSIVVGLLAVCARASMRRRART